jgi:hypothetical protein
MKFRIRKTETGWTAEYKKFLFWCHFEERHTFSEVFGLVLAEEERLGIVKPVQELKLYTLFFKLLVSMCFPTRWNKVIVVDTEARTFDAHLYQAKAAYYENNCDEFIIYIC